MSYLTYPHRRRRELPTAREQAVLDAVDAIAAMFSRYGGRNVGGVRDVKTKAVQIYLMKRALGWGFSRIGRRFGGVSLQHAMRLYPKGRRIVETAVADGTITPRLVASLLPEEVFI